MKIIFLNSHPIQYFVPLYQYLTAVKKYNIEVLYCSKENLSDFKDKEFGVFVVWDIPMLEGYKFRLMKNSAVRPTIYGGFWGLINFEIINILRFEKKSIVVVHGWNYLTNIITILVARACGHVVCIRGETPLNQELRKNIFIRCVKFVYLRFLFLFVHYFLFIGEWNRKFYRHFGINESKLLFCPYSVDNYRFQQSAKKLQKDAIKSKLGIELSHTVVLFSGKLISKKRPIDLLMAFEKICRNDIVLIFVGDGELSDEMKTYCNRNSKLNSRVRFPGFINQSEIPSYYCLADIFVMCSGMGETWGLSINEAMNFKLPLILSRTCGGSLDLVIEGVNGYLYNEGDISMLAELLQRLLNLTAEQRNLMGEKSFEIISNYSFEQISNTFDILLRRR